jgi:hypothetical protein
MKSFIVCNQEGKILRTGYCPNSMLEIQAGENEIVIEGVADDSKHYIKNKKVAEFTSEMKSAKEKQKQEMESKREKDNLIRKRIDDIVRNQAIAELKKEGKLGEDYNG